MRKRDLSQQYLKKIDLVVVTLITIGKEIKELAIVLHIKYDSLIKVVKFINELEASEKKMHKKINNFITMEVQESKSQAKEHAENENILQQLFD